MLDSSLEFDFFFAISETNKRKEERLRTFNISTLATYFDILFSKESLKEHYLKTNWNGLNSIFILMVLVLEKGTYKIN